MGSHAALQGWLRIKTTNTRFCCVKHYENYNTTHVEHQNWTRLVTNKTRHMVPVILSTFRNVLHNKTWFYLFLSVTNLAKLHGIPQCASISYVLDLIELLFNGWPEYDILKGRNM
jgi:hypothetical protein